MATEPKHLSIPQDKLNWNPRQDMARTGTDLTTDTNHHYTVDATFTKIQRLYCHGKSHLSTNKYGNHIQMLQHMPVDTPDSISDDATVFADNLNY